MTTTETTIAEVAARGAELLAAGDVHAAYLYLRTEGDGLGNPELLRIANLILPCRMHTQAMLALHRVMETN